MAYNPFDKSIGDTFASVYLELLIDRKVAEAYYVEYEKDEENHIYFDKLYLWLIGAAFIWSSLWLLLNISLGNYSSGAKLTFLLLSKLGLTMLIPEDIRHKYNKSER